MASFTPAGGGGVPVSASLVGATNPTLTRIVMALADTEQSYALPSNLNRFRVTVFNATLKIAYTAGESGTNYMTIPRYCFLSEDQLSATGLVLYFQSPVAGTTIEIESWS